MIRSSQRLSEELPELKRQLVERRHQFSQAEKDGATMAEEAENAWKEKGAVERRLAFASSRLESLKKEHSKYICQQEESTSAITAIKAKESRLVLMEESAKANCANCLRRLNHSARESLLFQPLGLKQMTCVIDTEKGDHSFKDSMAVHPVNTRHRQSAVQSLTSELRQLETRLRGIDSLLSALEAEANI